MSVREGNRGAALVVNAMFVMLYLLIFEEVTLEA